MARISGMWEVDKRFPVYALMTLNVLAKQLISFEAGHG